MPRLLTAVLALAGASVISAQEPAGRQTSSQKTGSPMPGGSAGRFYGPIVSGSWPTSGRDRAAPQNGPSATPTTVLQGVLPQPADPCSVPLIIARIPDNVNYTIIQVHPTKDRVEPMPKVIVPAPSCTLPAPR